MPPWATHDVVAVSQRCNAYAIPAAADAVARRRADEAVDRSDRAVHACCTVPKGGRPGIDNRAVVPTRTADHIVAVAENCHTVLADQVARCATDQTIGRTDYADSGGSPAAECNGASI